VKAEAVAPDVLLAAITAHLVLYKAAYGAESMRPKHHYVLHLPQMLLWFGFLLSTMTQERKHRIVKRYTRDRKNLTSWSLGAIEEVTCHQCWELTLPFFLAYDMATPRGERQLAPLRELFPHVPDDGFTLVSHLKVNGGQASSGDVVSALHDGTVIVGELLLSVGVEGTLYSFVSAWQLVDEGAAVAGWGKYRVRDDAYVRLQTSSLDTVFTYAKSSDGSVAHVYFPIEVRPRA
jgi:hypothetical protein